MEALVSFSRLSLPDANLIIETLDSESKRLHEFVRNPGNVEPEPTSKDIREARERSSRLRNLHDQLKGS